METMLLQIAGHARKEWRIFCRVIKDIHTIKNGEDYCWVKVWTSIGMIFYMYVCVQKLHAAPKEFSIQECFFGISAILGAGAGASKLKQSTEPD